MNKEKVNVWMLEVYTVFDFWCSLKIEENEWEFVQTLCQKIKRLEELERATKTIIHFYRDCEYYPDLHYAFNMASMFVVGRKCHPELIDKSFIDFDKMMFKNEILKFNEFKGFEDCMKSFDRQKDWRPTLTKIAEDIDSLTSQYDLQSLYFVDDFATNNVIHWARSENNKYKNQTRVIKPEQPLWCGEKASERGIKGTINILDDLIAALEKNGESEN